jgi:hypothetical protein
MLKKVEAKCKRCKKEFCRKRTEQEFCSTQCRNAAWKKPRKRRLKGKHGEALQWPTNKFSSHRDLGALPSVNARHRRCGCSVREAFDENLEFNPSLTMFHVRSVRESSAQNGQAERAIWFAVH